MRSFAILVIAGVATISVLFSLGFGPRLFRFVNDIPGGDVTGHFALMALLAFAVASWLGDRRDGRLRSVARATAILAVFVTFDELLQLAIPARRFSATDLVASYAGLAVGSLVALGTLAVRKDGQT